MIDKQAIKDFVDMMENPIRTPDSIPVSYVKMTTSYKALKSSISPVSEDKAQAEEYTTIEGHVIEVGKYYETRNGTKAKIHSLGREQIYTGLDNSECGYICNNQGSYFKGNENSLDLMRPWIEQPTDTQSNVWWDNLKQFKEGK